MTGLSSFVAACSFACLLLGSMVGEASAETVQTGEAQAATAAAPVTVAVLGFEATGGLADPAGAGLSDLMSEVLEAMLSGQEGVSVVNRSALGSALAEQAVNLGATTDPARAVAIGHVVGAKLLVTGRAFELGESRVVTARVIGTETTRTRSVMVRNSLDTPLDAMVFQAAEEMVALLAEHASELVAQAPAEDPIPALVAKLTAELAARPSAASPPVVAVIIPEEHVRGPVTVAELALAAGVVPGVVPDPAVETEIKKVLIDAGVVVRDLQGNALADWIEGFEAGGSTSWPRSLEGVDLVVVGEGFSEGAGSMGRLRFASARAEINVVQRSDGRIVLADRVTTRGVDLAEQVAGKTALEKAGRHLAAELLRFLIDRPADH